MLSDKPLFLNSQSQYRRLKRTSQALGKLQMALDTKLLFMEGSLLPASKHYGMHSLPNEVLVKIIHCYLDLAAAGEGNYSTYSQ